ncbi:MAG: PQQ-binding-like beta-propeller repeat protein [Vicinamibacterales bacterium]|nr:PQQ-binding-like beta-propeller repeat protein [Vicinamibacterales bacterium]
MMKLTFRRAAVAASLLAGLAMAASGAGTPAVQAAGEAHDWPEWRGPSRDGRSAETNLPSSWSPSGENLAWRIPYGGRSAPVAFGDRLYLLTAVGDPSTTQEQLVAIDAATGKVVWERRFSVYLSDVPQHRAAWASPSVDPETGTIYVFTVGAELIALSPAGEVLWTRSMPEEHGAVTTHGGRTTSPIIEGDLVILNALILAWGDLNRPGNRYFAFNKRTGETVWISSPQARHYDTNYSMPIVVDQDGERLLIVGGTDGAFHAIRAHTGTPLWRFDVSKRAILNSALYRDGVAYITHGEENLGTTEMGMVAAVDARRTGDLTPEAFRWRTLGFMPTFASPVMDGERLYSVDNGAVLAAFDLKTGAQVWTRSLGTLQKGSPVLADGKLYVGTENGRVFILRPSATGVEILSEQMLGDPAEPEPIVASPIIADGRVYITSMSAMYAIGERRPRAAAAARPTARPPYTGDGIVASVQVFPYEALLAPGATQAFTLKLFDAKGNLIREAAADQATWAVDQLAGQVAAGTYAAPASGPAAGFVKATVDGVTGQARVRVVPPLPWAFDFEQPASEQPPSWWVGAAGKVQQRTIEGVGNVLLRPRDDTVGRRAKILMGMPDWQGYTVEADVRGREQRRQRGDAGLINQRYAMVLFGNGQKLELHPWQAADEMTVQVPFAWDADTWYRMKLRVDTQADGTTLVRGKVWPAAAPEPEAWTVEKVDRIPHVTGAPGLYADGISDMYFDNFRVTPNR